MESLRTGLAFRTRPTAPPQIHTLIDAPAMAKICGIGRIPRTQCRQEHESRAPMPLRVPSGGPGGLIAI